MLIFVSFQRERAFLSTAARDSSVDRPDPEHDLPRRCTQEKNRNACHSQDRRDYERNDKYDNEGLCGRKPQRKLEETGDDALGGPSISPLSFNDNHVLKSESLATLNSTNVISSMYRCWPLGLYFTLTSESITCFYSF